MTSVSGEEGKLLEQYSVPVTLTFNNARTGVPFQVIHYDQRTDIDIPAQRQQKPKNRPISLADGLLLTATSNTICQRIQQELEDFKSTADALIQGATMIEPDQLVELQNHFLQGTRYLGTADHQLLLNITQQIQFQGTQVIQNNIIHRNQLVSHYKDLLICAIYEQESLNQVESFIGHHEYPSTIVIIVNTIESLEQSLKRKLFSENTEEITYEIKVNQYFIESMLVIQYQAANREEVNHNVLFFITYNKYTQAQIQSLAYDRIAYLFDPHYLWVTKVNIIPIVNQQIIHKLKLGVSNKDTVALSLKVNYLIKSNNPLKIERALWVFEECNQLSASKVINFNHDMQYSFYDWNKLQQINAINQDLADDNMTCSNIYQGPNYLLSLAALKSEYKYSILPFGKFAGELQNSRTITNIMEQSRKFLNSQYFQHSLICDQKALFISVIGQTAYYHLKLVALFQLLHSQIKVSLIIYFSFICSYEFIFTFDSVNQNYSQILSLIFPLIFILMALILQLFSSIFNSSYRLLQVKKSVSPLCIDGKIYIYCKNGELASKFMIADKSSILDEQCLIADIETKLTVVNKNIILKAFYKNQEFRCTLKDGEDLKHIRDSRQIQTSQIFQLPGKFRFDYYCEINDASNTYEKLFILGGILNVVLLIFFAVNIIFSYGISGFKLSVISYIIYASIALIILEKIYLCLRSSSVVSFVLGMISHLIYYIPINIGMHIYAQSQIDRSYDNTLINAFYYQKVYTLAKSLTFNIVCVFTYIIVERALGYRGYILLGTLSYLGLQSLLTRISCLKISFKKKLVEDTPAEKQNKALFEDDFTFDASKMSVFDENELKLAERYYNQMNEQEQGQFKTWVINAQQRLNLTQQLRTQKLPQAVVSPKNEQTMLLSNQVQNQVQKNEAQADNQPQVKRPNTSEISAQNNDMLQSNANLSQFGESKINNPQSQVHKQKNSSEVSQKQHQPQNSPNKSDFSGQKVAVTNSNMKGSDEQQRPLIQQFNGSPQ